MFTRSFQIFSFLNVFFLLHILHFEAEAVKNERSYDIEELIRKSAIRYKNSVSLSHLIRLPGMKFGSVHNNLEIQPIVMSLKNSSKCLDDIIYTFKNKASPWAWKLFDSFGKPESGILLGNVKWLGNYGECLDVQAFNPNSSDVGNYRGKYCTLSGSINFHNVSIDFSNGICVPDSCSADDLKDNALQILHETGALPLLNNKTITVRLKSITCKPREHHLNDPAKAVISLLAVLTILVVLGSTITAIKYFKQTLNGFRTPPTIVIAYDNPQQIGNEDEINIDEAHDTLPLQDDIPIDAQGGLLSKLETFLSCFCVFKNGAKLLNTDVGEGQLLCLHGIRFLSMSWVILGHTYLFGIEEIKNIVDIPKYTHPFLFQMVLQGFYAVDSFFVLSGFLLAYLTIKELAKNEGKGSWVYFYFHRYIRLTPVYMIILGFSATVYLYVGSGPYWTDADVDKNCKESWWRNLLYINNFIDTSDQCMGWTWYLANEMQFFIISPIFLISLYWKPKIGYFLITIFLLACWVSNFYITYHYELTADMANLSQASFFETLPKLMDYLNKIYTKPYTRIGPYLIGLLTGYLLFRRKEREHYKHSLIFLCVGWTVVSIFGLLCIFDLHHTHPSVVGNSFYNALSHTVFALCLAWVIYACLIGQGGVVNAILSCKFFIPLSRLTYAAYLIHPLIITGYYASLKTSIDFNHPTMVFLFLSFLVVAYSLALPVSLVLEYPVIFLEKMVLKCFAKKSERQINN